MLEQWETHECWVAHFDILGFKSLLDQGWMEFKTVLSQSKIDDILNAIENIHPLYREHIDYLFYADTFIFYSKSDQVKDYPSMLSVSQKFIRKCISIKLPVRGAISFGELIFGHEKKGSMAVFVGREAGARLRSVEESKGRSFPNSPEGPVRGATVRAKYGGRCAAAFCLSFSRHEEIYRSDVDGAWKSCKGVGICASPTAAATSPDFDFSVRKK